MQHNNETMKQANEFRIIVISDLAMIDNDRAAYVFT